MNKDELAFMEMAKEYEEPSLPEESSATSGAKNLLKAAVKGVYNLGRTMGPTYEATPSKVLESFSQPESQTREEFKEQLEATIPSQPSGSLVKAGERFLEEAPTMAALAPGNLLNMIARTALGSTLEQITEDVGGGEIAQNLVGLTAYLGPDAAKKLLESGKSGELVKAGRELGLTDKQIAPLLNSERKQKWLSKLTSKRGRAQKVLENTKAGLNAAYEGIKKGSENPLTEEEGAQIIKTIQDKLFDMPDVVRQTVSNDLKDFASKPITKESIINFWQDINANLSDKTRQLSNLKDPLREGLAKIDPKAANQFESANKLYGKYREIASRLKPNLVSDLMGASQALKVLGGISFGYYPILVETLGEQGAKILSREMMINPRFQQLSRKMVSALNQNKMSAVKKITDSMIKETKDTSPKAAQMMQSIDWDEWETNR